MNRNAILYDFLQVNGGAEEVTLGLCNYVKQLDLVTSFINDNVYPNDRLSLINVRTLTTPTQILGWQTIKSALAFKYKTKFLKKYDKIIYSGSNAPLAIRNSNANKNIYYCHTPPRFVYDLKSYYLQKLPLWQKPLFLALVKFTQTNYEKSLASMDVIFSNSSNVQKRLKEYLNVDSEVLYPPCDTERFRSISIGNYFLSTARLEDYKCVKTIVRAFIKMPNKNLVITSGGSQEKSLRKMAKGYNNITFTSWVSEDRMVDLIGNCIATIYVPIDEDFGMSPVESMSAGKAVIGVNSGGIKETVIHGVTGYLCSPERLEEDIISYVSNWKKEDSQNFSEECMKRANIFSSNNFYSKIRKVMK